MQTILLGRDTGGPRRTDDATLGADEAFFCSQDSSCFNPPPAKKASL